MSAAHSWAVLRPYLSCALAKRDDDASSQRDCASRASKKEGDPEGETGSPLRLLGSRALRSWRAGVTQPGPTSPAAWQWHGARSDARAQR
jgi:hypothetical protein